MIFTVVFLQSALDELADIWTHASDRQAVTEAANRIDQVLRRDAVSKGFGFQGNRLIVDRPLAAIFTVSVDDCLVQVLQIIRLSP